MENTENYSTRKAGRQVIDVKFPTGEFTIEEAFDANDGKVSKVTIQNRINEFLLSNKVVKSGEIRLAKVGRPRQKFIFKG